MKNVGIIKRALCISLVFLLNINALAAVVSDNDGSAFITKAEFDSLKNNFQSQIDSYNQSIDSKIDGAIASYLAGINLSNLPLDYWTAVQSAVGGKLEFYNSVAGVGSLNAIEADVNVNGTVNLVVRDMKRGTPGTIKTWFNYWRIYTPSASGAYFQLNFGTCSTATSFSNAYWYSWYGTDMKQGAMNPDDAVMTKMPPGPAESFNVRVAIVKESLASNVFTWSSHDEHDGSVWEYHKEPSGALAIDKYYSNFKLAQTLELYVKDYKNFPWSTQEEFDANYLYASQRNITGTNTIDIAPTFNYGNNEEGTKVSGTGTQVANYSNNQIVKLTIDDNNDYKIKQWGTGTTTAINLIENTQLPILKENKTVTKDLTYNTWYNNWAVGVSELAATYKTQKYTYPVLKITTANKKLNQFANSYLSSVAGETVYLGGGAPVVKTNDDGQKLTFTGTFKEADASGTQYTTANNIKFCLSDGQFKDGAVDTANGKNNITGWIETTGGSTTTFEIPSSEKNKTYWINMYSKTSGRKVWLEDLAYTVH